MSSSNEAKSSSKRETIVSVYTDCISDFVTGWLYKLEGGSWWHLGKKSRKRRFCCLEGNLLFVAASEERLSQQQSREGKVSSAIDLQYFDVCEADASSVAGEHQFVIHSTIATGLYSARHVFEAESAEVMNRWIDSIQRSIKEARLSKKPKNGGKKGSKKKVNSMPENQNSEASLTTQIPTSDVSLLTTIKRTKGPTGRRLPQRHNQRSKSNEKINGSSMGLSNSTSFLEELHQKVEGDDARIDERPQRVSRSMSSISCTARGTSISSRDVLIHDSRDEILAVAVPPEVVPNIQIVPSRNENSTTESSKRSSDTSEVKVPVPVQRRNTMRLNENQSLMNELDKRLAAPNNRVSKLIRDRLDSATHECDTTSNNTTPPIPAPRSEMFLGDLKSSISQVEGELKSVRKDIGSLQELLVEKHRCDVIQEQLEASLSKVNDCQQKFAQVISEAEEARDELKTLVAHCKQLVMNMESDINHKRSSQAIFI